MARRSTEGGPAGRAAGRFRTTRWSVVLAARGGVDPGSRAALAELCEAYWFPIYAFIRRKGHDEHEALDLARGFFARLLEPGGLASVDPGRGRFRSFLMACCSHFLSNRLDHDRALKRGGGRRPVSIDAVEAEGRYLRRLGGGLTPERLFDRQWAITLLDRVLARLDAEMAGAGKSALFEALRPALLGQGDRAPFAEIGAALGLSEQAARAAARRLRGRYRDLLREEVGQTLDGPDRVDDEIRDLFASLGP